MDLYRDDSDHSVSFGPLLALSKLPLRIVGAGDKGLCSDLILGVFEGDGKFGSIFRAQFGGSI